MAEPQMTKQTLAIVAAMLDNPTAEYYGLELMKAAKLKSGTIYPALARLERAGWLKSTWEKIDPSAEKRPRRRLYTLTAKGHSNGIAELDQHFVQLHARWRQRPARINRPAVRLA